MIKELVLFKGKLFRNIELKSQYDSFLAECLVKYGNAGSGKTSYLSKTIYEELIYLTGKEAFSFIVKELRGRKYFSISVDPTHHVSHLDHLTATFRYIFDSGSIE